jgi:hypothetical protein
VVEKLTSTEHRIARAPAAQNQRSEMHLHRLIQTFLLAAIATAIALAPTAAAAGTGSQHAPLISERWFQRWSSYRSPAAVVAMRARHAAMAKLGGTPKLPRPVLGIVDSGGFHWSDAGVGAGAALGFVAVACGAVVVIRGNRLTRSRGGSGVS